MLGVMSSEVLSFIIKVSKTGSRVAQRDSQYFRSRLRVEGILIIYNASGGKLHSGASKGSYHLCLLGSFMLSHLFPRKGEKNNLNRK